MKLKPFYLCLVSCVLYLLLGIAPSALSQVPQGFNYQAVAFNASGVPLGNQALQVRITIESDSLGGIVFWQELHSSVTTSPQGVINLVIGKGARESASTLAKFNDIDWSITPKFLKTEINFNGWKTLGASRIWSVPYSQVAGDLAGSVKRLAVEGETALLDEALFEVKNRNGQTIFAVYNEGVRIYVDDGAKGPKGGFSVGGFDMTKATKREYFVVSDDSVRIYLDSNPLTKGKKSGFAVGGYDMTKGVIQNYLDVSGDSVRVYIDSDPTTKKIKGGFAVGGYDMTKTPGEEYLRVTRDSTRVNVNNNPAKGLKGGFSVGGFDATKGTSTPFTSLTPKNYFIGHEGGHKITSGQYNSAIGYQSGKNITTGESNAFLGYQAGFTNSSGLGNLFLGYQSGLNNETGNFNSFIGYLSGFSNSSGMENSFLGSFSGKSNTIGSNNTFLGFYTGYLNTEGNSNVFIGTRSGYNNTSGNFNSFIGFQAGLNNTTGKDNVFIGNEAGKANNTGESNVYIGNISGLKNTSGNLNVFIGWATGSENITGSRNTFLGYGTGQNNKGNDNVYIGSYTGWGNTTGQNNTYVGSGAAGLSGGATGSYNAVYGYNSGAALNNGNYNTLLGYAAGWSCTNGSSNVFIGNQAGGYETGSNKLYISNNDANASNALIYGEFDNKLLRINGQLLLPYKSGNSILTITLSGGNSFFFKPQDHYMDITSDHTGNPVIMRLDKSGNGFITGYFGVGATTALDARLKVEGGGIAIGHVNATNDTYGAMKTIQLATQTGISGGNFDEHTGALIWSTLEGGWGDARLKIALGDNWLSYNVASPALIIGQNFIDGATLGFRTGNVQRMIINTSGQVGIGISPSYLFHANQAADGYVASFSNTGSTAARQGIIIHAGAISTAGANFISFQHTTKTGTQEIGSVQQTGATTISYNTTSDARIKEEIVDSHIGLDDLMKIKVRDFKFINDYYHILNTGFIAQELYDVYPNAVSKPIDPKNYWQIDYGRITPLIVKAVQDQQTLILSQQQMIESQQQQIDELKAMVEKLLQKQ